MMCKRQGGEAGAHDNGMWDKEVCVLEPLTTIVLKYEKLNIGMRMESLLPNV